MSGGRRRLRWLCDLLSGSLLPHVEGFESSEKVDERHLLLTLSRVRADIRKMEDEPDFCISDATLNGIHCCKFPLDEALDLHSDLKCLENIIFILAAFFGAYGPYVKHSAENVLFAVSDFLIEFEGCWLEFITMIWFTIHAMMLSPQQCTSSPRMADSANLKELANGCSLNVHHMSSIELSSSDMFNLKCFLQLRFKKANDKNILAGLFGVLRKIMKLLKRSDIEFQEKFIRLSILYLHKIPWIYYNELVTNKPIWLIGKQGFLNASSSQESEILWGSILQLLCSLVQQNILEDLAISDLYSNLADLVPVLLSCCFQSGAKVVSDYLMHKLLVLMGKLSVCIQQKFLHLVTWLKLLDQYFDHLLYQTSLYSAPDIECGLEGSPFNSSQSNESSTQKIQNCSSRHLQRQAIFVLIKCCFALHCISDKPEQQCSCRIGANLQIQDLLPCCDLCRYYSLLKIIKWFWRQYNSMIAEESNSPSAFALAFLRLYIDEDDMLFSILLLLLDAPLLTLRLNEEQKISNSDFELTCVGVLSEVFDPVHLLHIFLMLLHYDHLVIVDYLISKDTGVSCAQYLLRCLRLVCQSWHNFGADGHASSGKRLKTSTDLGSFVRCSMTGRQKMVGRSHNNMYDLKNSKECLLSLKKTLEDLHQKNLFPYNPRPLLRSLSRFQEISEKTKT